ncbi:MAG: hypothetical protein ACK2T3_13180, partial [Candidatus Promineifilaceae bacterium]
MLSKKAKRAIVVVAFIQIALIAMLLILPDVVLAIPGRYRVALAEKNPAISEIAESIIERVAPVEDFLPAPQLDSELPSITIPAVTALDLLPPTSTPEPTSTPVLSENV